MNKYFSLSFWFNFGFWFWTGSEKSPRKHVRPESRGEPEDPKQGKPSLLTMFVHEANKLGQL